MVNLLLRMRPIADGTAAGIGAFNRAALAEWGLDGGLNLGGTADGAGLAGARDTAAGGAGAAPAVRVFAWDAAHGGALAMQHGSEAASGKMSGNSASIEHKQVYYKLWHTYNTCTYTYSSATLAQQQWYSSTSSSSSSGSRLMGHADTSSSQPAHNSATGTPQRRRGGIQTPFLSLYPRAAARSAASRPRLGAEEAVAMPP